MKVVGFSSNRKQFVILATLSCTFPLSYSLWSLYFGVPLSNYYAEWPQQQQQPTVAACQSRKLTFAQWPRWHAKTKAALLNQPFASLKVFLSVFTQSDLGKTATGWHFLYCDDGGHLPCKPLSSSEATSQLLSRISTLESCFI